MNELLQGAQRLLILGSPGAGKSTLALELARRTGWSVVHLDALYWQASGKPPNAQQWQRTLALALKQPAWIMEGHYANSLAQRLAHADAVLYLDYPRSLCLWRLVRRSLQMQRADGVPADWLPRWDLPFLRKVWHFRQTQRPRDQQLLATFNGPIVRFERPAQLQRWLDTLPSS